MAASGKTPNFNIPIYNSGDTANYLTSYNNGMSIIDTQMQANKSAAAAAQAAVETLEQTVNTQAEAISEVKKVAETSKISWLPLTIQSENCTQQAYEYCGVSGDIIYFVGSWSIGKIANAIPNKVTNGSETWAPIAYIVDSNSQFSIQEGIVNIIINPSCATAYKQGSAAPEQCSIGMWKVGNNVYFGFNLGQFMADGTNAINSINVQGTWFIQP